MSLYSLIGLLPIILKQITMLTWGIKAVSKHSCDTTVYFFFQIDFGEWNPQNGGRWSADIHLEWRFLWISFLQTPWLTPDFVCIYLFIWIYRESSTKDRSQKRKKSFNPRLQFQFLISIFNLSFQFHFNFKFQILNFNFIFQFQFSISIFDFNFRFKFQISISNFNFKFQFQLQISILNFNFNLQIWIFSKNLASFWWHWKFVKNSFFTEFWNPISASVRPKPEFENLNSDSFETNPKFRENR